MARENYGHVKFAFQECRLSAGCIYCRLGTMEIKYSSRKFKTLLICELKQYYMLILLISDICTTQTCYIIIKKYFIDMGYGNYHGMGYPKMLDVYIII